MRVLRTLLFLFFVIASSLNVLKALHTNCGALWRQQTYTRVAGVNRKDAFPDKPPKKSKENGQQTQNQRYNILDQLTPPAAWAASSPGGRPVTETNERTQLWVPAPESQVPTSAIAVSSPSKEEDAFKAKLAKANAAAEASMEKERIGAVELALYLKSKLQASEILPVTQVATPATSLQTAQPAPKKKYGIGSAVKTQPKAPGNGMFQESKRWAQKGSDRAYVGQSLISSTNAPSQSQSSLSAANSASKEGDDFKVKLANANAAAEISMEKERKAAIALAESLKVKSTITTTGSAESVAIKNDSSLAKSVLTGAEKVQGWTPHWVTLKAQSK